MCNMIGGMVFFCIIFDKVLIFIFLLDRFDELYLVIIVFIFVDFGY